jgi:hypothetical protein
MLEASMGPRRHEWARSRYRIGAMSLCLGARHERMFLSCSGADHCRSNPLVTLDPRWRWRSDPLFREFIFKPLKVYTSWSPVLLRDLPARDNQVCRDDSSIQITN